MLRLNAASDVHSGKSHTALAASTVPAHVLKFFAVNVRPVISRRYALTATESTHWRSSVRHRGIERALFPAVSRHRSTMRASVASFDLDGLHHAALGAEVKCHRRAFDPHVLVEQRREAERVVRARVFLVADADQRLLEQRDDGGQDVLARQRRRPSRSACTRLRMAGSACAKSIIWPYFASSSRAGPAPGDSGAACAPGHRARSPADVPSARAQIQTSFHAGGITSDRIRSSVRGSRTGAPLARRDRRTSFHDGSARAPAPLQRRSAGRPPLPPPCCPRCHDVATMPRATARSVPGCEAELCWDLLQN